MTIKELLVMVEQRFSIFPEPITDERLQSILDGATLYHRDWSNRPDIDALSDILIEYNTDKPFNMRQLDKELPSGFYVYWDVIHYSDALIVYFQNNKKSAFTYYRTLTQDVLVCNKALIDTSKGIIVGEKRTGDCITLKQYLLFQSWQQKKRAAASDAAGYDETPQAPGEGEGEVDG